MIPDPWDSIFDETIFNMNDVNIVSDTSERLQLILCFCNLPNNPWLLPVFLKKLTLEIFDSGII